MLGTPRQGHLEEFGRCKLAILPDDLAPRTALWLFSCESVRQVGGAALKRWPPPLRTDANLKL